MHILHFEDVRVRDEVDGELAAVGDTLHRFEAGPHGPPLLGRGVPE